MKIALAQTNFTVGDLKGNAAKILGVAKKAKGLKADLVVFSELSITGYPPEDLVLKPEFQKASLAAIKKIARDAKALNLGILVGGIDADQYGCYNTAFLLEGGKIIYKQYKYDLPNYGVFDEKRIFKSGIFPKTVNFRGCELGIFICEDMWNYAVPQSFEKADVLISINSSPFEVEKASVRRTRAKAAVRAVKKPLLYLNQIGGQDELVFDGGSFVLDGKGKEIGTLPLFEESLRVIEFNCHTGECRYPDPGIRRGDKISKQELIYNALVLGLKDYIRKNNFPGIVLGLSGGIDSALSAAIAVDALGKDKVWGVKLPSGYTSKESNKDADDLAKKLGIKIDGVAIAGIFESVKSSLKPIFKNKPENIAEENMQSRIRGLLLMAISNKFGHMVLTTGNKSEMSVGYATLYGDMCGGFSVLKDVYKTEIYRLAKWRNKQGAVIPKNSITRAPTAELRANQKDQDSLPPYDVLDGILEMLIEKQSSTEEIVAAGFNKKTVKKVERLVNLSEYKRRQAPPGVKITSRSFGRDRRYPITNKFI